MYAESKCFGLATNMEAEVKAVLQALTHYIETGITSVQIQTDSLALKHMITGEQMIPWEYIEIVELIQSCMQKLEVGIIHILRKANQLADYIKNEAFNQEHKLQFHTLAQISAIVMRIINMDKSQTPTLRIRTRAIR